MTVSTALGLGAAYFGIVLSREFVAKRVSRHKKGADTDKESDVD